MGFNRRLAMPWLIMGVLVAPAGCHRGATGASMARAALTGAGYNVRINLSSVQDQRTAELMLSELSEFERRATQIEEQIRKQLIERGGMSLE